MSLSEQRERIQQEVELLQKRLDASNSELQEVSSDDTADESSVDMDQDAGQSTAGLLAQRQKIETEIQDLENFLGPHSPISASDGDDDDSSNSSSESELGLPMTVDSCLQMNLVYQQILQEKLKQLETHLSQNQRQQREALSHLSGTIQEAAKEETASPSYPKQANLFLGHFLKPYFKDKVTGLGPPANEDTKEIMMKTKGCLDNSKMKVKRWESWQKTLLIDSVSRDSMRRLIQPKLSRVDYLSQKLSLSDKSEDDKQQIKVHIENLEKDIESIKVKKEEELVGDRYDDHDWHKIAKVDFEGLREVDDLRLFWQNFLHPAINKNRWSADEIQRLKEISSKNQGKNWDLIAQELGTGRTAFMCLQTYQRFISTSLKRGAWSPDEDQKLTQLVEKMRIGNFIPYTQISYFMEGRDTSQLIYRWSSVLDPQLKKGPWSKEEDELLLSAVARHGEKRWWKIRLEVPGRTDGGCRDRYLDCLKEGIKKGAFDDHERQLLVQLVDKHGVGRWTKIAAEIPNRNDAQCLREWKKLMKPTKEPLKQRKRRPKTSQEKKTIKQKDTKMRSSIRRRLQKVKKKQEDSSQDEDQDEDQITYMDTDDEKEMVEELVEGNGDDQEQQQQEEEEEEQQYLFLPMHEWIPPEENQKLSFPSTQLVTLETASDCPLSGPAPVRSTVVAKFGRSVVVGPPPRELSWEERHTDGAMLMVSQKELHLHLCRQANKWSNLRHGLKKGHMTDREMDCRLQAAVLPWVGNVLTPSQATRTLADALGDKTALSSTPVFRLLLHAMMVDISGCKDVILRRGQEKVTSPEKSRIPPSLKGRRTVAGMLWAKRSRPPDVQKVLTVQQAPPTRLLLQSPPSFCLLATPTLITTSPRVPPPFRSQPQMSHRLAPLLPSAPSLPICLLTTPSRPVSLSSSLPAGPTHLPFKMLPLAPPPTNSSSVAPAVVPPSSSITIDHTYTRPVVNQPSTGIKRGQDKDSEGVVLTNGGKRVRKLTHKAMELQASPTKRRRIGCHKSKPNEGGATQVTLGHVQVVQALPLMLPAVLRPLPCASSSSPVPSQRAGLNIDPSLVYPGSTAEVNDWLSGLGGVAVPHMGNSLPYLPPCYSSLNALTAILRKKTQLTRNAAKLLECNAQMQTTSPYLPDATSGETESSLRALVKDRLGSNPAYLLLKARFLSVFALPALLATMRPDATPTSSRTHPSDVKEVKTKEKTQQHNVPIKFSCDGSGAPASHFSGMGAIGPAQPQPSDSTMVSEASTAQTAWIGSPTSLQQA